MKSLMFLVAALCVFGSIVSIATGALLWAVYLLVTATLLAVLGDFGRG